MIYWINFLHIYQPPWQNKEIVKKIAIENYRYLFNILKNYPKTKITLNICGSLTEQLINLGYFDIIKDIKKLTKKGQIELTGTAMYHAFLPYLPEYEIKRQIKLNENYHQKIFGKDVWLASKKKFNRRGFFIPEMAYSKKVAKIVASLGFNWIIVDEIAKGGKLGNVDWKTQYFIKGIKIKKTLKNLAVVFRNRKIYQRSFDGKIFDTQQILQMKNKEDNSFVLTARDGESYHDKLWNKEKDNALKKLLKDKAIKTLTVSEYLNHLEKIKAKKKIIKLLPCSWESLEWELKKKKPYEIWKSKKNQIHQLMWRFINSVIKIINQNQKDKNFFWGRHHLDRGLASCGLWWADGRFKGYNPEEIEKNLLELIKAIRSLKNLNSDKKIYFEKIYSNLIYKTWEKHWLIKSNQRHKKSFKQ